MLMSYLAHRSLACKAHLNMSIENALYKFNSFSSFIQPSFRGNAPFLSLQLARCLCEGLDVNGNYNVAMERERVTSVVFGSCYDDLHE